MARWFWRWPVQIVLRLALGLALPAYLLVNGYDLFFATRESDVRALVPAQFKLGRTLHFANDCSGFWGFSAEFEMTEEPKLEPSDFDRTLQRIRDLVPYRGKGLEASRLLLNRQEYLVYRSWDAASASLRGLSGQDTILEDALTAVVDCWADYDRKTASKFKLKDRFLSAADPIVMIGTGGPNFVFASQLERRLFVFGRAL